MDFEIEHIYSDGKQAFRVSPLEEDSDFAVAMFRVKLAVGVPVGPIIVGEVAGYMQLKTGEWNVVRVADPNYTKGRTTLHPYAAFETEILPKLMHVANSLEDYEGERT